MNDKNKESPKIRIKWLEKLKNVKHIEIIVVVIFIVLILLIYGTTFKSKKKSSASNQLAPSDLTIISYVDDLEANLEGTLSRIKGVSNVKVMITLDLNGATIEDNIIKTSEFPKIKGILIVASGVENTNVKLNVLKAVEAVVDISSGNIEILSCN